MTKIKLMGRQSLPKIKYVGRGGSLKTNMWGRGSRKGYVVGGGRKKIMGEGGPI